MSSLQSQLSLSVVKKSDLLSSLLLSMYQDSRSGLSLPTVSRYGENLVKHILGNVINNVAGPNKPFASQLDPLFNGDETCGSFVFGFDSYFRKRRTAMKSGQDALEYIVSEKLSKMLISQLFSDDELMMVKQDES